MKQNTFEDPGDSTQQPLSAPLHLDRAPIWEAMLGMLAVGILYAFLPTILLVGPAWLLLVVEGVFLLPIAWTLFTSRGLPSPMLRPLLLILLGVLTLALASSVALLLITLRGTPMRQSCCVLQLSSGLQISLFSVSGTGKSMVEDR